MSAFVHELYPAASNVSTTDLRSAEHALLINDLESTSNEIFFDRNTSVGVFPMRDGRNWQSAGLHSCDFGSRYNNASQV